MSDAAKRVLEVGNCGVDHAALCRLLEGRFGAEVVRGHSHADALAALRREQFDLLLVNRKFDRDHGDGIELIRAVRADPDLADVPTMLITNYDEHQQTAIAAGALPGFGKAELDAPQTIQRLSAALGER